jgi:rod shape-determining protein MreC
VIVPGGVIGKVLRVFGDTSQVILLTDANSGIASLLESSRVHGVLKGTNRPLAKLTYVINGEPVTVGEILVTSGEDRIYPKGLPLGVVVSARSGSEFQEIEVQPLAQLNRLEEVLVILEREPSEEWKPVTPASPRESVDNPGPAGGPSVDPVSPPPSTSAEPLAPSPTSLP